MKAFAEARSVGDIRFWQNNIGITPGGGYCAAWPCLYLLETGTDLRTIQLLLGHRSLNTTVEAASQLLEVNIAEHYKRFAVAAEQEGSAFVADTTDAWSEILCIQDDRWVGNDNTVKWRGLSLQLPSSRLRPHFVKATVWCMSIPTNSSRCSGARTGWPIITPTALSDRGNAMPHDPLRARLLCVGACPGTEQNEADKS